MRGLARQDHEARGVVRLVLDVLGEHLQAVDRRRELGRKRRARDVAGLGNVPRGAGRVGCDHRLVAVLADDGLRGLDGVQPPGTYMVVTEEEEIPGLSFQAWRRVSTQIHLPAMGVQSAQEQVTTIEPQDLAHARARDNEEQLT